MPGQQRIDWKRVASAIGAAIPRERLAPEVLTWVDRNRRATAAWHIALSGGADSVALLLLVWTHWPKQHGRMRALHFNHRLRGAASRADAEFARWLCRALGVRLIMGHWTRGSAESHPSEAAARSVRHEFFARHGRVLWLGHHQDDVAETMLMRLARGSGTGGLSAPRPVQPMPGRRVHLRPLLGLRKNELIAALAKSGGRWREDASNETFQYFRNRIRHNVLPAWVIAAERDAIAGAARSRELLAEDDAALEVWLDKIKPLNARGELSLRRLTDRPRAIVRRAMHRWILACHPKIEISRQAFESLLDAVVAGKPTRHSVGPKLFAVIRAGRLRLEKVTVGRKFRRRVN